VLNILRRHIFLVQKINKINANFRHKVAHYIRKVRIEWSIMLIIKGFAKALKRNFASDSILIRD
jgi:hypothetical protein